MPISLTDMSPNKTKLRKTTPKKNHLDRDDLSIPVKSAEAIIRNQNKFQNNILKSLTHPFLIIDANDYTIKEFSQVASSGDLPSGITCYQLTHGINKPCSGKDHICPVIQVKKTKKPVVVEHIHRDKDGNRNVFEIHAFPIFNETGEIIEILEYLSDITERKRAEEDLKTAHEKLITEQVALRAKNIALKEVLGQIESEEKLLQIQIQNNVERIIKPILRNLEPKINLSDKQYVKLLENSLDEVTEPFTNRFEIDHSKLSPRELEVCNMIKNGMSSKDIASALNISVYTVHNQRRSIRKKLKINDDKTNLATLLRSN